MAQPPPRKDAYSKFILNLHKDHYNNIQGKNQLELDLLDDISKFMKQKSVIEKTYAESLLKLSSVYGSKKVANKSLDSKDYVENQESSGNQNIFQLWIKVLDENEKLANLRLAAAQVFQEKISDEAKNLRAEKAIKAKKFVDRLLTIQKDVQESITELDRTRFTYHTEESEKLKVANQAEEADLKAKGKKQTMMSMFQSKTALEKQADKLSAKQEELNIKSTGARNEYLLSIETSNAHQAQYYQTWLKKCLAGTECGVHGAVSDYIAILSTTELATCNAQNTSLNAIKDVCSVVLRHGSVDIAEQMVQYNYEPVQGDQVNEVIVPENDAGIKYALTRDAKDTADKYNNAIRRIAAFNKRKAALSRAMKSGQDTSSLEEKIEEFEHSLNLAETERAKSIARLNKLREGGLPVDDYMETEKVSDNTGAVADWDYQDDNEDTDHHHHYAAAASQPHTQHDAAAWDTHDDWGASSPVQETAPAPPAEYSGELAQAIVLYSFDASSHDEMSVREGEWIHVLLSAPEEDGWVTGQNSEGKTGLVPSSFVCQTTPEQYEADQAALAAEQAAAPAALDNWAEEPAPAVSDSFAVPSCPPPEDEDSSEEDSQDDDDDEGPPPCLAPPPGPPPGLAPPPPPSTNLNSAVAGQYQALYDFQANADDELTIVAGDIVHVLRDGEDEGWLFGSINGKEGIFPSSYVEKCGTASAEISDENKDSTKEDEEKDTNNEKKSIEGAIHEINNLVSEAEEALKISETVEGKESSSGMEKTKKEDVVSNSSDEDSRSSATESESEEDGDKDKNDNDLR